MTMHPKKLEQKIFRAVNRANRDFRLFEDGDKVMVAVSGGKDSFSLLWALLKLKAAAPYEIDLVAYHLDQGAPGHDTAPVERHFRELGVTYEIEHQDTYSRVVELTEPGKVYCSLCSRFRRAIIYKAAKRHGCKKIALGHHRDDLIETLLLNVLYSGQIKSMPPKLRSDDGCHQVVRPLCYAHEDELRMLASQNEFPVLPPPTCQEFEKERRFVKELIATLSERSPHIKGNILAALGQVHLSHLMDKRHNPLLADPLVAAEADTQTRDSLA